MKDVIHLLNKYHARFSVSQSITEFLPDFINFAEFVFNSLEIQQILKRLGKEKALAYRPLQLAFRDLYSEIHQMKQNLIIRLNEMPDVKKQIDLKMLTVYPKPIFGLSQIKDPFFDFNIILGNVYADIRDPLAELLNLGYRDIVQEFADIVEFGGQRLSFELIFPSTSRINGVVNTLKGLVKVTPWGMWTLISRWYLSNKNGISPGNIAYIRILSNLAKHEKIYDYTDRFCLYLLQTLNNIQVEQSKKIIVNELITLPRTSITVPAFQSPEATKEKDFLSSSIIQNPAQYLIHQQISVSVNHSEINKLEKNTFSDKPKTDAKDVTQTQEDFIDSAFDFFYDHIEFFYDSGAGNLWIVLHTPKDLKPYFMGHFRSGKADDLAQQLMDSRPGTHIKSERLSHTCGELNLKGALKSIFFYKSKDDVAANIWNGPIINLRKIEGGIISPKSLIKQLSEVQERYSLRTPQFSLELYSKESRAFSSK